MTWLNCPLCEGQGKVSGHQCGACKGRGQVLLAGAPPPDQLANSEVRLVRCENCHKPVMPELKKGMPLSVCPECKMLLDVVVLHPEPKPKTLKIPMALKGPAFHNHVATDTRPADGVLAIACCTCGAVWLITWEPLGYIANKQYVPPVARQVFKRYLNEAALCCMKEKKP